MRKVFSRVAAVCAIVLNISSMARAEARLVSIGDRRLSINCDGQAGKYPTVVLLAGGNRTSEDWAKIQPAVAAFTEVCSDDRAVLGKSDTVPKTQSVAEIVEDLHTLLTVSGETGPYVLVGHSIAGIFARAFEKRFTESVAGLVFVD